MKSKKHENSREASKKKSWISRFLHKLRKDQRGNMVIWVISTIILVTVTIISLDYLGMHIYYRILWVSDCIAYDMATADEKYQQRIDNEGEPDKPKSLKKKE